MTRSPSLAGNVAALAEQLKHYDATTSLSGSATAGEPDWFRKQNSTSGILAAK